MSTTSSVLLTVPTRGGIVQSGYQGSVQPGADGIRLPTGIPTSVKPTFSALPSGIASPVDLAGEWFVAQVEFQQERRLVETLSALGIGYFVPLVEVLRRDEARKQRRRAIVPLLAGYVFVCPQATQDAYTPMRRNGVYNTIDVCDQPRFIKEIVSLHRATESGLGLNLHPHVKDGSRCRITAGNLRGIECLVIDRDKKDVVLLEVSILGRLVEVENIPIEYLEPID